MNPPAFTMSFLVFASPLLTLAATHTPLPGQTTRLSKAQLELRAIEVERQANLKVYRREYLPNKEWLTARHSGEWVVIAGGKMHPVKRDDSRVFSKLFFEPAKTLAAADRLARAAAPDARHRFVFRIGEDGDHEYEMGITTLRHVLGGGFQELLPGEAMITSRAIVAGGRDGKLRLNMEAGKSFRLRPRLFAPVVPAKRRSKSRPARSRSQETGKTNKPLTESFLVATVFTGIATVSASTDRKLRLALWEIPGKVTIRGKMQSGTLRRTRLRMGFDGTKFEIVAPVAVWPASRDQRP